jgi:hypothetical protein
MPLYSSLPAVNHNTLLIVGNGLNRAVDNSAGWKQLIDDLVDETGFREILQRSGGLPLWANFVTLYQEIALHNLKYASNDLELKQQVAEQILDFQENVIDKCDLHRQLMNLSCDNILTTNYDYILEDCITDDEDEVFRYGDHKETTFSLYRGIECPDQTIWHIHGEADYPQSINLGHNQYAGYLHRIRDYLIYGTDSSGNLRTDPLLEKIRNPRIFATGESWLDLYFSRPVIWLGFSLSMSEYVLWWLVFYRAELARRNSQFYRSRGMHFVNIFDPRESAEDKLQRLQRNRMLETSGVFVHDRPVQASKGWAYAYKAVINELGS